VVLEIISYGNATADPYPLSLSLLYMGLQTILSLGRVTVDGVWMGNRIYCTLTTCNFYK
jgi:hypothetical protein